MGRYFRLKQRKAIGFNMQEGAVAKKKVEKQQNTYQGTPIDLTDISKELTEKARRFVFWFAAPYSDAFLSKKKAAIAAGYARKNAATSGYKLTKNPKVIKEIEKLSKSFDTETIDMLYRKYLNTLEIRAFYDPADFVSGATFKAIEEIAPEKRAALEQPVIDMKEGKIVGYTFGSRRAAMAEIEKLYERQHPDTGSGQDEETLEVIMERVTLRQQRRQRDAEFLAEMEADIVDRPNNIEL
jgi:hypothetical protein